MSIRRRGIAIIAAFRGCAIALDRASSPAVGLILRENPSLCERGWFGERRVKPNMIFRYEEFNVSLRRSIIQ